MCIHVHTDVFVCVSCDTLRQPPCANPATRGHGMLNGGCDYLLLYLKDIGGPGVICESTIIAARDVPLPRAAR